MARFDFRPNISIDPNVFSGIPDPLGGGIQAFTSGLERGISRGEILRKLRQRRALLQTLQQSPEFQGITPGLLTEDTAAQLATEILKRRITRPLEERPVSEFVSPEVLGKRGIAPRTPLGALESVEKITRFLSRPLATDRKVRLSELSTLQKNLRNQLLFASEDEIPIINDQLDIVNDAIRSELLQSGAEKPSPRKTEPAKPILQFNSVREAEKAKLPKGTIIIINGRQAIVE